MNTCVKPSLLVLFLAVAGSLWAIDPDKGELMLGFSPGFITGTMSDVIEPTLSPVPDGLQETSFVLDALWYFMPNVGVQALARFGAIQAEWSSQTKPLSVISDQSLLLGPSVRAILDIAERASVNFEAGGGLSLHSMQWNSDYTDLFPGYVFSDINTSPGFYGRVGVKLRASSIVGGISVIYESLPEKASSGTSLKADCWTVPVEIGIAF